MILSKKKYFLFPLLFLLMVYTMLKPEFPSRHLQPHPREQAERPKQWCHFPELDIDAPSIKEHYSVHEPLKCWKNEKNWVYVLNGTFYIDSEAETRHGGKISCNYSNIVRIIDDNVKLEEIEENFKNESKLKGDFFKVDCRVDGTDATYSNYHAGVVPSKEALERSRLKPLPPKALGLNVYMLGFDSLSRLAFIRNLPKMYNYLTEEMGAIVLEGYNIQGDGTPQALTAIFTGKTEPELPECRRRFPEANYVNVYPWVWNEYRDGGYVTLWGEDGVDCGTFTHRHKGFKEQPTDHYLHTFYSSFDGGLGAMENKGHCMASEAAHKVHFDYAQHFWNAYPEIPKFAFLFHSVLSHSHYSKVSVTDDYMVEHLKFFVENGHWNNTILIAMADHGHRYGAVRSTAQGKLEERLPFFSFAFPPWFKAKYPETIRIFKENSGRLTSPFDIHATLQEILNFHPDSKRNRFKNRSLSLFHPIPDDRTCSDAGIEPHWCTCLKWDEVPITDPLVQSLAMDFVQKVNEETQRFRNLCTEIKLQKIDKALVYKPQMDVLKYRGAQDIDGRVPDLSDTPPEFSVEYYQLHVWTTPGEAHYEVSITWDNQKKISKVDLRALSHVNKYGDQSHCIEKKDPSLLQLCKCYDKI